MAVSNPDFAARADLNSVDLKFLFATSVSLGAGVNGPMGKPIPRTAAAVIFTSNVACVIQPSSDPNGGVLLSEGFAFGPGATPVIGLELQQDITVGVLNRAAVAGDVGMIVLGRRRTREKFSGQV